jgi:cytochrome P450
MADTSDRESWRSWTARPPLDEPGVGWVVRRHADVRSVLEDPRYVVPPAEPAGPVGSLAWLRASVARFCNGPEHARRRAIATAEIDRLDPRWLRERARQWTASVVDRAGREPFDVMERLARIVPVGVVCAGLGVSDDDDLAGAIDDVIAVSAAWRPDAAAEHRSRAEGATQRLTRLLGGGTVEATANRIGVLVQACDATAGLIGNALNLALRLPPSRAASWPVEAVLAETLRYDPPVWSTRRRTAVPVELDGRWLPAGTTVLLHLAAANRDPAVVDDPHRFDPSRAEAHRVGPPPFSGASDAPGSGPMPAPHLTFGHGRRPCPGGDAALALAGGVVEVVLAGCQLADPHVALEPSPNLRIPSRLEVARR